MNIGHIKLDGDLNIFSKRGLNRSEPERKIQNFYHDLPRLFLILIMLLGAILGYYVKSYRNEPLRVIRHSSEKTLRHSFNTSLEGSTIIRNTIIGMYRSRQNYSPEKGISNISDINEERGTSFSHQSPIDPVKALELLSNACDVVEYGREDMYGYGTRHFSGLLSLPDDSEALTRMFEYWVNMRTLLAVRLIVTYVEGNGDIDARGIPILKEMYINIRYHDWRKPS